MNMYGWAAAGVNHVLIFEIDPRNHLTYQVNALFLTLIFKQSKILGKIKFRNLKVYYKTKMYKIV